MHKLFEINELIKYILSYLDNNSKLYFLSVNRQHRKLFIENNIYFKLIKEIILEYSVKDFPYSNPILLSRNINDQSLVKDIISFCIFILKNKIGDIDINEIVLPIIPHEIIIKNKKKFIDFNEKLIESKYFENENKDLKFCKLFGIIMTYYYEKDISDSENLADFCELNIERYKLKIRDIRKYYEKLFSNVKISEKNNIVYILSSFPDPIMITIK